MSVDELQEFVVESRELIGDAEKALLAIEAGGRFADSYDAMFRAFHSIKGMAGMLDLGPLQSHVHQLESGLVALKDAEQLSRQQVDLFLRGCDATLKLLDGEPIQFDYSLATAGLEQLPPALTAPAPAAASAWDHISELVERACAGQGAPTRPLDQDGSDFLAECDDAIARVVYQLLALEKGETTDPSWIDTAYRDIHTIKGGAQLFGLTGLAEAADTLETALEPVRHERLTLAPADLDALVRAGGAIQNLVARLRGQPLEPLAQELGAALQPAVTHAPPPAAPQVEPETAGAPANYPPPPAPTLLPVAAAATAVDGHAAHAAPAGHVARPAAGEAVAAAAPPPRQEAAEASVRVPVALLDRMMASIGEMVLVRNQVLQFASRSDDFEFLRLSQRLDIVTSEIQGEVMKTRMQPVANVLDKFQRIVRDLSHSLGKRIDLVLLGTSTELDKTLLEAVKIP